MKGIKIIPFFLAMIMLSYAGMLFVEANRDPVSIKYWHATNTPSAALGLVVLSSILIGMIVSAVLCGVELLALYFQNQSLKKKLIAYAERLQAVKSGATEDQPFTGNKPELFPSSGRLTP